MSSNEPPPPNLAWGGPPAEGTPPEQDAPLGKPSAWPILGWAITALVLYFGIALLAGAIASPLEISPDDPGATAIMLALVGGLIATTLAFLVLPTFAVRRMRIALPAWRKPTWSDLAWAVGVVVASYAVIAVYTVIVEAIGNDDLIPRSTIEDDDFRRTIAITAVTAVLVILIAPFAEEVFFRRFLVGGLRRAWGAAPALLISAAIFSALHADLGSMIPFALVGLIFGFAYIRSESLTAPTIAHLAFNIIGFTATIASEGVG